MHYIDKYKSPIGMMTLGSDGDTLTGLWFDNQKYFAYTLDSRFVERELPIFSDTKKWLDIYFNQGEPDFMPRISMICSDFRRAVWNIMLSIPYGQTMTYGEIAKYIIKQKGYKTMSAQAIGGAVGHNSISIIIPCHRVVGANGSLTGYAGGIDRKIWLLEHESAALSSNFVSKKL